MLDYPTLKILWWLLVGVLLVGFAIMDGHDMGVGTLLPFVGKTDDERRVAINTVGPHWDGNQVWFITGGGAIFAAWPLVYATAFSGFYWAMLAVLWALFFRPVGFDYRSKIDNASWRSTWDWGLFVGGAVPPLIFGVAFGNLLQGVPFHFDNNLMSYYTGSFWGLLNPFALLCGVVSTAMITFHGAIYLMHRTEGDIYRRSRVAVMLFGALLLIGFSLAGVWLQWIPGYAISSVIDPAALPDPLAKQVVREAGAWMHNYQTQPATLAVPILAYLGIIAALLLAA
ncbi:MAG TPA: cytochrome d ubiquinol oxidase subunit II, partial [Denitromonas sp.]|nr:cytochrome d ubiquinol oxidase subunit II [Denitromonas sp.]